MHTIKIVKKLFEALKPSVIILFEYLQLFFKISQKNHFFMITEGKYHTRYKT